MTTTATLRISESPFNRFHSRLTPAALLSPFADGYVVSVIGVIMASVTLEMQLSSVWQGVLGSSVLLGIFIGSLLGGWLADRIGRRLLFRYDLALLVVGSIGMLWAPDPITFVLLRILTGIATGASYPIAATVLTEYLPTRSRGGTLSMLTVAWFSGALAAYAVGAWLLPLSPDAWRWVLALAAVPGALAIASRLGMPESVRWLVRQGRDDDAAQIVHRHYGHHYGLGGMSRGTGEHASIAAIARGGYLGRLLFVAVFWGCSLVPLYAIYAFGPILLDGLGFEPEAARNASLIINVFLLIGCVIWGVFMNRLRRRTVVTLSFLGSGLALLGLGLFPAAPAAIALGLFILYALTIGGSQLLQMIYPNEIFPTAFRGTAVGLASAGSRVFAILGTFLMPLLLDAAGAGVALIVAAAICFAGLVTSVIMAPETRDTSTD